MLPPVLRQRLGALAQRLRYRGGDAPSGSVVEPTTYDQWLWLYHGEPLRELDERCRNRSTPDYRWFRDLDDDLWAILLSKQYSLYPNLRRALPDLPLDDIQVRFTGHSGIQLAIQSLGFYRRLKELYGRCGAKPLGESRVLDFGCGWGRLTRHLARDVAQGELFGCDPNPKILDLCKQTRVPARLAQVKEVPTELPFSQSFDLVYAYSVFTHLSEATHLRCLQAIHAGLDPEGVVVLTVRPPAFITTGYGTWGLESDEEALRSLQGGEPAYAFAPQPTGPLKAGTYGAAVMNLAYMRERWSGLFTLREIAVPMDDVHQVVVTLGRRDAT